MDEDLPEYSDVKLEEDDDIGPSVEESLEPIAQHIDYLKKKKKAELEGEIEQLGDETDSVDLPDTFDVAAHKYDLSPDIPKEQQKEFSPNRAFFGVHVVNSNTKRVDNFRHLMTVDLTDDYDLIPTRRHRGNQLRSRVLSEYQMCRSNPEIGGFDRKMQRSVLKREDVDVRSAQTLNDLTKKQKKGILNFLRRKK